MWRGGQAPFVYRFVGGSSKLRLVGRRFQTLRGVEYLTGFGGASKVYGKYPELSPISRLALHG